ncbi:MAG: class I SAM-dependent methyltransferase [Pseudomonadales bacterium]
MSWLTRWREKRSELDRFRGQSRSEVFEWIYGSNKWGGQSRSGKGSGLERTYRIRQLLPGLLEELEITSILDIPCGDHDWIATLDFADTRYIGADIVPALIERNREKYPGRRFEVIDVCEGSLPDADFVLCRDLLVHLSLEDISAALENLLSVQGRYLMCTTFPDIGKNKDIVTGKHRRLNMCLAPFGWPAPMHLFEEGTREVQVHGKCQGVWSLSELRSLQAT